MDLSSDTREAVNKEASTPEATGRRGQHFLRNTVSMLTLRIPNAAPPQGGPSGSGPTLGLFEVGWSLPGPGGGQWGSGFTQQVGPASPSRSLPLHWGSEWRRTSQGLPRRA